jgi:hypothetical protein
MKLKRWTKVFLFLVPITHRSLVLCLVLFILCSQQCISP